VESGGFGAGTNLGNSYRIAGTGSEGAVWREVLIG
jgi:hypothetical protein